jgi:hypothetical protein
VNAEERVVSRCIVPAGASPVRLIAGEPGSRPPAAVERPSVEAGRRTRTLHRWPSLRSMKRIRQRIHDMTDRRQNGVKDVRVLIRRLNPVLVGWGNYFKTGNAAKKFNQLDEYVSEPLHRFMVKRKGRNLRPGQAAQWDRDFFWNLGLHRLRGTVRYPTGFGTTSQSERPPVSRVRENRTHGLKGGLASPTGVATPRKR